MKRNFFLIILLIVGQTTFAQYHYPLTKTVDSADTYWGVTLHDPYRWLEDEKNPEVMDWLKVQSDYTNSVLVKIPNQDKLIQELNDLNKVYPDLFYPTRKAGGKYFYRKMNLSKDATYKFYCRNIATGKEALLFDPQKYIDGKTMEYRPSVSDDGTRVIFGLTEAGKGVGHIRILDVASGKLLSDSIPDTGMGRFVSGSNSEIIYPKVTDDMTSPDAGSMMLHSIGTPVSSDIIISNHRKNPDILVTGQYVDIRTFDNCPFVFVYPYDASQIGRKFYYAPKSELKNEKINWKQLTRQEDEVKDIWVNGNDIYLLTAKGNPYYRIIKTNINNPNLANAQTIAEGNEEWMLSDNISVTKDYLVFSKTHYSLLTKTYSYEFKTGKSEALDFGSDYNNFNTQSLSAADNELVIQASGWALPENYYSYDIAKHKLSKGVFYANYNIPGTENLVYEELEVSSHDGVLVPLSIVYDKTKMHKDGNNILYISGYGAYGAVSSPYFDFSQLPLLERGVIYATAHVRGGGEKGNDWYLGGKKKTKPNTWKDFNACIEYLIKNKYTSADKTVGEGASAGGILIGRAITERPDLYKAAIVHAGSTNAVRFEFVGVGASNIEEYGTVKNEEDFPALLEMDAYHHIEKGIKYPAQLVEAGINDPRVPAFISGKFAAKMQANTGSGLPVLLDVNYNAGHFGGTTADEFTNETARRFAFILWQCGDKEFQP